MIIDHTHPHYKARLGGAGNNKYNGAYYYSKEIVKNIIPELIDKTDRNWVTVNVPTIENVNLDHSIVFIHNNLQPNAYQWLRKYKDLILVCGVPSTMDKVRFFGTPIYVPLSIDVKTVKRYRRAKTKEEAFAGRIKKLTNRVPKSADILTGMSQSKLLAEMARYKKIYAVGRTALQAKVLGCEIGVYDARFPDPRFWRVIDNHEASKILLRKLNEIDGKVK